jgi:hypothetical protein
MQKEKCNAKLRKTCCRNKNKKVEKTKLESSKFQLALRPKVPALQFYVNDFLSDDDDALCLTFFFLFILLI